jgi:2-polyprenyl-6-methoxyphenol hydroxylase-like FAD-dependent oxidoreductase
MEASKRTSRLGEQAVVIGASMAGLCAARVLADRFTAVVVLDRDTLGGDPTPRRLVPQGRHPHLLLTAGVRLLDGWFPGLTAELCAAGAVELDLCRDFLWHQAGGIQRRPASSLVGPSMSRPLLEWTVRRRVMALPNVNIRGGVNVSGITLDDQADQVVAVQIGEGEEITADLVVDATGRHARSIDWLAASGYPAPPTTVVEVDTRYVTRVLERNDSPARDWKAAAVIGEPDTKRLAMLLPIEGDRWILSIAGINGEIPPTNDDETVAYARTLGSPVIADLIAHGDVIGEPVTHRFPANQRRHVERLRRYPLGWVLLGDSVCSFDPIYGQGMTSAAQQADALGRALDRHRTVSRAFARRYFRAAARIVNIPWSIAVGGDFAYPDTKGNKPLGTDILNRYIDRVIQAGQCDDTVVIRFNEVVTLVRGPHALLAPSFVLRVLAKARRIDRARRGQEHASRERTRHGRRHKLTDRALGSGVAQSVHAHQSILCRPDPVEATEIVDQVL